MKYAFVLFSAALFSISSLSADPSRGGHCPCEECDCTPDNHCGCMGPYRNYQNAGSDYNLATRRGCGCGCHTHRGSK